jgi:rod shape-determining protein MreC
VIVKPAAQLDRLDEVLVITSTQPRFSPEEQQDLDTSEALKGPEAAAINEQKKASEIMAEHLPGLIDPKLPADQQPLKDSSNPNPVAHPPIPLHPDRFTPGSAVEPAPEKDASPEAKPKPRQTTPGSGQTKPATAPKPRQEAATPRNP